MEYISKINSEITSKLVKVVVEDGLQELKISDAIELAYEQGLDLVEMSVQDGISICKIMDYRKHLYDVKKKQKNSKQQSKQKGLKEIRLRPNIDDHDLMTKANKTKELLEDGYKVKISVMYRGREISQIKTAKDIIEKLLSGVGDYGVAKKSAQEGNTYSVIVE